MPLILPLTPSRSTSLHPQTHDLNSCFNYPLAPMCAGHILPKAGLFLGAWSSYLEPHTLISFIAYKYPQITAYLICNSYSWGVLRAQPNTIQGRLWPSFKLELMGVVMNTAMYQICPPVGSNLSPWVWEAPPAFPPALSGLQQREATLPKVTCCSWGCSNPVAN